MTDLISNLIGNNYLATVIMSLIPMIELKGGIVYALGSGMPFYWAFLLAYAGSTIVFFPIFFLLKPILKLVKKIKIFNRFANKIEWYIQDKANREVNKRNLQGAESQKKERQIKMLCVFIFVAIPLPLTGIWMGTAVAVFLNMKFKDSIVPIVVGNFIAGLIILGLSQLCIAIFNNLKILDYFLYALFAIAVVLFILLLVKIARKKPSDTVVENNDVKKIDKEEK